MKHLVISDYGSFVGVSEQRLLVREKDEKQYFPLNRLATISIAKKGIHFSSDLIAELSYRGIKLFFLDFRGVAVVLLMQHCWALRNMEWWRCVKHSLVLMIKLA